MTRKTIRGTTPRDEMRETVVRAMIKNEVEFFIVSGMGMQAQCFHLELGDLIEHELSSHLPAVVGSEELTMK